MELIHSDRITGISSVIKLRVESLKPFQSRGRGNAHLALGRIAGNHHNGVTVKVRTGKPTGNLRVDTDGIGRGVSENSFSLSLLVVHS